ncbi:MAG: FadR family transcriptional regulator [Cellulomonadaceae bacterium]|nr:FadR family transcriptional regulator [Cellulomonadaceae bacterium]
MTASPAAPGRAPGRSDEFRRIAPAYQQVARQMRELIVAGTLVPGERLPSEDRLAASFGVGRGTVREALRMLVSEGLAETTRGVTGGTFVVTPRPEVLEGQIETGLGLLSGSDAISTNELYQARVCIEVPCSRWAAENRSDADLARMEVAALAVEHGTSSMSRAESSHAFHQAVVDAAGNRLLSVIAPPIWRAMRRSALRSGGETEVWNGIDEDHVQIMRFIERRDADGAADAMARHLDRLHDGGL